MSVHQEDEKRAAALAELDTRPDNARMYNDRQTTWNCTCCDAEIRIPAGVTVVHNGLQLRFDTFSGLSVDGQAAAA